MSPISGSKFWWKDDESVELVLADIIRGIDADKSTISDLAFKYLLLYDPRMIEDTVGYQAFSNISLPEDRLRWNIVQSIIDTVVSIVATSKLRVAFLTQGATWVERQRAQMQSDLVSGLFWATDLSNEAAQAFKDACWNGNGYIHTYTERGQVKFERVFPSEIKVDRIDGHSGAPRSMHRVKCVNKSWLQALYPEFANEIESAQLLEPRNNLRQRVDESVSYGESWHLPSYEGAGDGKHILWCSSCKFKSEPWTRDSFPITKISYNIRPKGYDAQGLAEQLRPSQREVNQTLEKISKHLKAFATKTFIKKGTKVDKKQFNNKEGAFVEWAGQVPPQVQTIAAIAPEYYNHLETLYRRGFEIAGVNQLAAQAQQPSGVRSGKALRVITDQQSRRFMTIYQAWENLHLEVGLQGLMALRDLAENKQIKTVGCRPERGGRLYQITHKELLDLVDVGAYKTKAYVIKALDESPAGRYEAISDALQLDPRYHDIALNIVDDPDLRSATNRIQAPRNLCNKIIGCILSGKPEDEIPEPDGFMELPLYIENMKLAIQEAMVNDEQPERIERLRRWVDEAINLIKANTPPPEPQMAPGMPMAAPQASGMPMESPGALQGMLGLGAAGMPPSSATQMP